MVLVCEHTVLVRGAHGKAWSGRGVIKWPSKS